MTLMSYTKRQSRLVIAKYGERKSKEIFHDLIKVYGELLLRDSLHIVNQALRYGHDAI